MTLLNQRIVYSCMFYILVILLIFVSKPDLVFDHTGSIRKFGLGPDMTMFSFGVLIVAIAFVSFYIFAIIDLIFIGHK
jgi:hypothetical protein